MNVIRFIRHVIAPAWWTARRIGPATLAAIERAVAASETRHRGELRFVVEGGLPTGYLLAGRDARARAIDLFAELGVWDTADNSGVLIYLQLIDRRVEIVADRGIHRHVGQAFWNEVCREMEIAFRGGAFEAGALAAVDRITAALAEHFPPGADNPNELPDRPVIL